VGVDRGDMWRRRLYSPCQLKQILTPSLIVIYVYVIFPGKEFNTRGVRAEEATSDLLKYMGKDPKYKKANGYNPSWLFTGMGLGKRSV
jgi:hypothetical protein